MTHLLVEDRLSLTTVTRLLAVVTALSLREERILALLVLRHFMGPVRIQSAPHFEITHIVQTYVCFLHALPLQSVHNQ